MSEEVCYDGLESLSEEGQELVKETMVGASCKVGEGVAAVLVISVLDDDSGSVAIAGSDFAKVSLLMAKAPEILSRWFTSVVAKTPGSLVSLQGTKCSSERN